VLYVNFIQAGFLTYDLFSSLPSMFWMVSSSRASDYLRELKNVVYSCGAVTDLHRTSLLPPRGTWMLFECIVLAEHIRYNSFHDANYVKVYHVRI
jgi:hypothetical protein